MRDERHRRRPLLLLLDIDGTLCPTGPGPGGPMMSSATGGGASGRFRADLPEQLQELATRFELVWATAWQDSANLLLAPALGLPPLPVLRFRDPAPGEVGDDYLGRTWKLPSVRCFAGERALAWVDDDLHPDAYAWAARRAAPARLITTEPALGLEDADVRGLLAFARRPGAGVEACRRGRRPARALEPRHEQLGHTQVASRSVDPARRALGLDRPSPYNVAQQRRERRACRSWAAAKRSSSPLAMLGPGRTPPPRRRSSARFGGAIWRPRRAPRRPRRLRR